MELGGGGVGGGDQPSHVGSDSRDEDGLVLPIWWDEKGDIRPRSCTSHPTDPPKKGDGGEVMGPRMSPGRSVPVSMFW